MKLGKTALVFVLASLYLSALVAAQTVKEWEGKTKEIPLSKTELFAASFRVRVSSYAVEGVTRYLYICTFYYVNPGKGTEIDRLTYDGASKGPKPGLSLESAIMEGDRLHYLYTLSHRPMLGTAIKDASGTFIKRHLNAIPAEMDISKDGRLEKRGKDIVAIIPQYARPAQASFRIFRIEPDGKPVEINLPLQKTP